MSVIGVYDFDYFTYPNVIPNLECAKLLSYYKQKRDLTMLAPQLEPARYNRFFIRKDYDDGQYPQEFFQENVNYGGRAFSANEYVPLPTEIEKMEPDFSPYDRYMDKFISGLNPKDETADIKRILRASHLRLSIDGKNIDEFSIPQLEYKSHCSGFIIHDYHPERIEGALSLLKELSQLPILAGLKQPYKIGMKFPVVVGSAQELRDWLSLPSMPTAFSVQYNGQIEDKAIDEIARWDRRTNRQLILNPAYGCRNDNEFMTRMLHCYRQMLYLLSNRANFLLEYNEEFPFSRELLDFIILLNSFIAYQNKRTVEDNPDLIYYLRQAKKTRKDCSYFTEAGMKRISIPVSRAREVFQFLREKNYELFALLYEAGKQVYEGGKIIGYDQSRNQAKN